MITAKPKISAIYSVQENMFTVKTNSATPTLLSQRNASYNSVLVMAYLWRGK